MRIEAIKLENILLTSVNEKYYRNFSLTKKYGNFKSMLSLACKNHKLKPPYGVYIYMETALDCDNPIKAIFDSLGKVITNDKKIQRLEVDKKELKRGKPGTLKVDVWELD